MYIRELLSKHSKRKKRVMKNERMIFDEVAETEKGWIFTEYARLLFFLFLFGLCTR